VAQSRQRHNVLYFEVDMEQDAVSMVDGNG
jgi:hypothetical protein